ncbi:hypothetical protein L596_006993 [Steinernema carpocapsae]|uniref:Metalloendopeptidase n=1 Tax=Steinernema carpocapsae TaxID=34508 RepID=A0A4U5P7S8_STECR|nr:hypothetical protein L596_006993 [Steinernema carpocapsae]
MRRLLLVQVLLIGFVLISLVQSKRGKRIDLYQQRGGDILQIRPNGRQVMYNSLPRGSAFRWTKYRSADGYYVIPYITTGLFDLEEKMIIQNAMKKIEENSCIRFRKRRFEPDYVDIQNQYYQGCFTSVGRLPGQNVLMLEANKQATCVEHDIVIHEMFHTIGLWHEHMRYDRDDFIKVHSENIDPMYHSQFAKVPKGESDTFGVKYDYRSVMHYAKNAFARSTQLVSMETLDKRFQNVIGKVKDASPSDYRKICTLYECKVCRGDIFSGKALDDGSQGSEQTPKAAPLPKIPKEPEMPLIPKVERKTCEDKFSVFCQATIGERSRGFMCEMFNGSMKTWCCESCGAEASFSDGFDQYFAV